MLEKEAKSTPDRFFFASLHLSLSLSPWRGLFPPCRTGCVSWQRAAPHLRPRATRCGKKKHGFTYLTSAGPRMALTPVDPPASTSRENPARMVVGVTVPVGALRGERGGASAWDGNRKLVNDAAGVRSSLITAGRLFLIKREAKRHLFLCYLHKPSLVFALVIVVAPNKSDWSTVNATNGKFHPVTLQDVFL